MTGYKEAAVAHFTAKELEAKAVLQTYFKSSVGIGEHSELPTEVYKWVERLATAQDCLHTLGEIDEIKHSRYFRN